MYWWLAFLTGLTTGGLSCLAMQGGLLASVITNQKEAELISIRNNKKPVTTNSLLGGLVWRNFALDDFLPVGAFLLTKLIVHTFLGMLLGLIGSSLALNLETRLAFQTFTAMFMFATAMNLLNVHPIFRYLAFQPPQSILRWIRAFSKSKPDKDTYINRLFAPAILGLMTIFIPCGVTQAMEVLAINSGDPWQGAMIMFFFVLGTSPLFAILGIAAAKLTEKLRDSFLNFAAYALIGMALYALNGVLVVFDSPFNFQKLYSVVFEPSIYVSNNEPIPIENKDFQSVTIQIQPRGYSPNQFTVKAGIPVQLTLISQNTYTCALDFTFREFGIFEMLEPTDEKTVQFTPMKPGRYMFSCSMGMYVGYMDVI